MSVKLLNVTEDHIKLLKSLEFEIESDSYHLTTRSSEYDDKPCAFGYETFLEEAGIIIYGKPETFDPDSTDIRLFTEEQEKYMKQLFLELPDVLTIRLQHEGSILGNFRKKYHKPGWKKVN